MRKLLAAGLILFTAFPAYAGTYNLDDKGQLAWKPDHCDLPAPPPALREANSETAANDMNARATQYNAYVKEAQAYMNCVSTEAEKDATAAGQSVVNSGQGIIDKTQADLEKLKPTAKGQ
jgi:hypothetical protein